VARRLVIIQCKMYDVSMHRTQLMIEDWHYETLRARAEREGRSLSAIVREILDAALSRREQARAGGIGQMEGIGEDPGAYGEAHDQYLYGEYGDGQTRAGDKKSEKSESKDC